MREIPIWLIVLGVASFFAAFLFTVHHLGLVGIDPDSEICRARSWGICGQLNSNR